jgi:hypothetical protein
LQRERNRSRALLTCTLACALAALALPAAGGAEERAKDSTRALVVKDADSPLMHELTRRLDLELDRTPPRRGKASHDLLIVDGDVLSARRMGRHRALGEFAASDRWILALDVDSAHHRRALAEHTGFTALADGEHRSRAFLFRRTRIGGAPQVVMLDAERLIPSGLADATKRKRKRSRRNEIDRVAGEIAERIDAGKRRLATVTGLRGLGEAQDIPPDALRVGWPYQLTGSHHPDDGHFSSAGNRIPAPGHQESEWTMTHVFQLYLNNFTNVTGDYQVVTHDFSGEFTPARDGSKFFQMFDLERAWWTGLFDVSVNPTQATSPKLASESNLPPTANETTNVSSEESFSVGIHGSREGAEATLTYNVSHGKSYTVPDFGLVNSSAGNHASWQFSARHPCDARPGADVEACFPTGYPANPSELSRSQIVVDTSSRWRTRNLLTGNDGLLAFDVGTPVTLIDSYCGGEGLTTSCANHTLGRQPIGPAAATYTIDATAVLPVPVNSLSVKPNPANGANLEKVTGTVELARPAPFDTDVVVYSNKQNAVVGPPVGDQISQGVASIDKGETEGTFTIRTKDNGMHEGETQVAVITAFYGGVPTQKQLTVCSVENGPCPK